MDLRHQYTSRETSPTGDNREIESQHDWIDHDSRYRGGLAAGSGNVVEAHDSLLWGGVADPSYFVTNGAFSASNNNHANSYASTVTLQYDATSSNTALEGSNMNVGGIDFPSTTSWATGQSMHSEGSFSQDQNSLSEHDFLSNWPFMPETPTQASGSERLVQEQPNGAIVTDPSISADSSGDEDSEAEIGIVLKKRKYKCNVPVCSKTFGRPAELRRHHDTIHAVQKPEFWCTSSLCERNAANGGQPFHRKYNLQNHVRAMHKGGDSSGEGGAAQG